MNYNSIPTITATSSSIFIHNPHGLECMSLSWQQLSMLNSSITSREDCIEAMKAAVHVPLSTKVLVSSDAEKLFDKYLETVVKAH